MPELIFEGRRLWASDGQTVAAALTAHGVRVFGRSSKYHRPRGVRCANGTCSCCAMRVDGLPGVRTCVTTVRDGMRVEREHAWPSAELDLLRAAELAGPALHAGAYYGWFRRSPRLWGLAERALAAAAGQADLPSLEDAGRFAESRCETRRDVDVLVVGGGIAGLSAALAAAQAGARTLLVERHAALGGVSGADAARRPAAAAAAGVSAAARGCDVAGTLAGRARAQAGLEVACGSEAVAWYEDGTLAVSRSGGLLLLRPQAVVLASGAHDLIPPFVNGDLPGVITGAAVLRLLQAGALRQGRVAVVLADGERGYEVAEQLQAAGVGVAGVADTRPARRVPDALRLAPADCGIRVLCDVRGVRAHGLNSVRAVTLHLDPAGSRTGRTVRVAGDLICVCLGARPADELARQARGAGRLSASTGGEVGPGGARLFVAGGAASAWSAAAAVTGGSAAGRAAALVTV